MDVGQSEISWTAWGAHSRSTISVGCGQKAAIDTASHDWSNIDEIVAGSWRTSRPQKLSMAGGMSGRLSDLNSHQLVLVTFAYRR